LLVLAHGLNVFLAHLPEVAVGKFFHLVHAVLDGDHQLVLVSLDLLLISLHVGVVVQLTHQNVGTRLQFFGHLQDCVLGLL
jgi:hypothetical protein